MEPGAFLKLFGRYVREIRLKKQISVQEMAKICDIPEDEILQLENGQVDSPLALLLGLADAFNMELHELFAFSKA
ncbi:hypothetical protein C900_01847 [Fulvivirga imtechensis AK7]|uniref:HTH cro/C1-type domain-containing protein n=1 Tax=Fulvivirga imtechensis AK7 TaxID=1237149 RepID=L8JTE6_9BACT|nr:helix-turn-helix domain-containing protein [Fulvivirga imtechensis]ELR72105.1 hypothetical protein C900_01847 [Fulvivirga imtechensis AK7]